MNFKEVEDIHSLIDAVLLEFKDTPQIHELSLRLLRNLLDYNILKPSKLLNMKGFRLSDKLTNHQRIKMNNNTNLNLKAEIIRKFSENETLINRFINSYSVVIEEMLKIISYVDSGESNNS